MVEVLFTDDNVELRELIEDVDVFIVFIVVDFVFDVVVVSDEEVK